MDKPIALMETASPDLEKQGFFAAVFINREYSVQQEKAPKKIPQLFFELCQSIFSKLRQNQSSRNAGAL